MKLLNFKKNWNYESVTHRPNPSVQWQGHLENSLKEQSDPTDLWILRHSLHFWYFNIHIHPSIKIDMAMGYCPIGTVFAILVMFIMLQQYPIAFTDLCPQWFCREITEENGKCLTTLNSERLLIGGWAKPNNHDPHPRKWFFFCSAEDYFQELRTYGYTDDQVENE